jgi:hypothetical protein
MACFHGRLLLFRLHHDFVSYDDSPGAVTVGGRSYTIRGSPFLRFHTRCQSFSSCSNAQRIVHGTESPTSCRIAMRTLTLIAVLFLGKNASSKYLEVDGQGTKLRGARHLFARISDPEPPSSGILPESNSTSCPNPADGACTREYLPVSCGPRMCVYANRCLAKLANFTEDDCEPATSKPVTCPLPDSLPCTMEYMPVKCGQEECEYDNRCLAVRAGYEESDCTVIND